MLTVNSILKDKPSANCTHCAFMSTCLSENNPGSLDYSLPPLVKQQYQFKRGHTLYHTGQPFQSIYVVRSGILKASAIELEGNEHITDFYFQGEAVGLDAISSGSYPHTIQTLAEAVVCEIPFAVLLNPVRKSQNLPLLVLKMTSQRLTFANYIHFFRAEQRIAGFLLELTKRLNCSNNTYEFILPMSRQAIGNYLRLTPETVIRTINSFHQKGILVNNKKQIKLHDLAKLNWLVQGGLLKNFVTTRP